MSTVKMMDGYLFMNYLKESCDWSSEWC